MTPIFIRPGNHKILFEVLIPGQPQWMTVEVESQEVPFTNGLFYDPIKKFPAFNLPPEYVPNIKVGTFMRAVIINELDDYTTNHRTLIRGWLYRGGANGWQKLHTVPTDFLWHKT